MTHHHENGPTPLPTPIAMWARASRQAYTTAVGVDNGGVSWVGAFDENATLIATVMVHTAKDGMNAAHILAIVHAPRWLVHVTDVLVTPEDGHGPTEASTLPDRFAAGDQDVSEAIAITAMTWHPDVERVEATVTVARFRQVPPRRVDWDPARLVTHYPPDSTDTIVRMLFAAYAQRPIHTCDQNHADPEAAAHALARRLLDHVCHDPHAYVSRLDRAKVTGGVPLGDPSHN